MDHITQILRIAGEDLAELLPYFFLAVFISAMVDILYLDVIARRSFKKHGLLGIVFTTLIGALSPFCSFTVIPLIRKLLRTGVPLSAVMAFWIASPAMDPPIFALTAAQIGLPLATARLFGALVLSLGAGLLIYVLERRGMFRDVLREESEDGRVDQRALVSEEVSAASIVAAQPALVGAGGVLVADPPVTSARPATATGDGPAEPACAAACDAPAADDDDNTPWWPTAKASLRSRRNWKITARNFGKDSLSLGKWLVFACVFEAVIRVFVPTSFVTDTLGAHVGLLAIPLATLIAIPLYLNGVGAIPIVGGLLDKGMASGAAISFMLGGAITTIPAMVAVRSVVNNKVFGLYLGIGVVGSILLGFVAQLVL
ncbi:permease [Dactylosporangium sp. CA-092794]|uniref:permease n=1 Tax=Dactylosporangium sp. CA-092794 TaxID=3239929 RepID=UPI003D93625A